MTLLAEAPDVTKNEQKSRMVGSAIVDSFKFQH